MIRVFFHYLLVFQSTSVLKENDPKTHEIRRNIFDRFFKLKHIVTVATNGEQLNRECSLFTDDGKYVEITFEVFRSAQA